MTFTATERTKGRPFAWSPRGGLEERRTCYASYAKLKPAADLNIYYTNSYCPRRRT